jgi:hypothetical protein
LRPASVGDPRAKRIAPARFVDCVDGCIGSAIADRRRLPMAAAATDLAPAAVQATLNYIVRDGEKIFSYTGGPGSTEVKTGGTLDPRGVTVKNGRLQAGGFSLERNGFRLVQHETRVADFYDAAEVRRVYYPEIERLVREETGAARVVVFDHTLRTADDAEREARKLREVVPRVHNDYTDWSGPQRLRDILPDEAEALLSHRFAIVQVWRPIRHPVETFPLAVCDAQSVSSSDLVISERRYPNRIGQTYAVAYNPSHRWYWFPRQRREEAIVFKVYDSLDDGRARFTAHTAFADPTSPEGARPRESIEVRTFAFF